MHYVAHIKNTAPGPTSRASSASALAFDEPNVNQQEHQRKRGYRHHVRAILVTAIHAKKFEVWHFHTKHDFVFGFIDLLAKKT